MANWQLGRGALMELKIVTKAEIVPGIFFVVIPKKTDGKSYFLIGHGFFLSGLQEFGNE